MKKMKEHIKTKRVLLLLLSIFILAVAFPLLEKVVQVFKSNVLAAGQPKELERITISQQPTTTDYRADQNFDSAGLKIMAHYTDGSTQDGVTFEVRDGNNLVFGQDHVTIRHTETTGWAEVPVTVHVTPTSDVIIGFSVKEPPTKTHYLEGDNFDSTGMVMQYLPHNSTR